MWRLISGITDTQSARRDILFKNFFFRQEVNVKPNLSNYNSVFLNDCLQTNDAFLHRHTFCTRQAIYLQ